MEWSCCLADMAQPRIEHKTFKVGSKSLDISTIATNYHIEVNPRYPFCDWHDLMWHSDLGHNDEHVIRTLLKEVAMSQQLDSSVRAFKGIYIRLVRQHVDICSVVVLSEADKLSKKVNTTHHTPSHLQLTGDPGPTSASTNHGKVHIELSVHPLLQQLQQGTVQ